MRKLLLKLFVKDYKNVKDAEVRAKYGSLSGIVGIVCNLFLCVFKIIAGFLSGSVAIMADGINNLSDAGSSIITLIGFKLSTKPADEDHPFGHERIEYITGVIVSFIILLIGALLCYESVQKIVQSIKDPSSVEVTVSTVIYIILGVSILVKCWLSLFNRKNGKDIDSSTLIATAQDSLNDCISTSAVIIGMIVYHIWSLPIDGYIGVFVSIFIIISGIKTFKETTNPLIGEDISKEIQKEIADKVLSYEGILGVHDLVVHSYGPNKIFATIHAEVSAKTDILESHDIIDNIERDFREQLNIDLVIHMDPIDITDQKTMEIKKVVMDIVTEYDSVLTIHDFRVVHGQTHTNVLFDVNVPIKFKATKAEIREYLTQKIKEYDEKLNPVIQIDQLYDRK